MGMGTRKSQEQQEEIWIANADLARSPGHPFYQRLNELLDAEKFDEFVEGHCRKFYALEYRFLSSMQGALGVGADLNKWTPGDFAVAKRMIAQYKSIRETIQRGLLYRLIEPVDGSEESATEYVSRDGRQTVLFAFLHSSSELYRKRVF
jgi:hypothetical protein